MLSGIQFMTQESITEMDHPPCSPDLVPNDFWLFPKIKSALKGRTFPDIKDIAKKNCYDCTESYSTTEVSKMFPNTGSIVRLSA
jgi:hypothetical protein